MVAREGGRERRVGGKKGVDVFVGLLGRQEVGLVEGAVETLGELDAPKL